jgi:hypothetical protein
MIKYCCDRCEKELNTRGPDREIVMLYGTVRRYRFGTERDGQTRTWVLCNTCSAAFEKWITLTTTKEQDDETGNSGLQVEPKMED